ncbi:MAG: LytTR family transcriptional regulator DNA-binding domain-containing protein [Lachnospiraceae bacterium]|nr:LytTR family transcriptional regulator DNA-binding domain-containing protein [Lachnospiraceae bacterium]
MKITINQVKGSEPEVTVTYDNLTPEVVRLLDYLKGNSMVITGKIEDEIVRVKTASILYIESVDDKTFAYTANRVIRLAYSLAALEEILDHVRFFRCSKSMILNIDKIERLKSLPSNRIDATMLGGEHILITRTYAANLRRRLQGGNNNE